MDEPKNLFEDTQIVEFHYMAPIKCMHGYLKESTLHY